MIPVDVTRPSMETAYLRFKRGIQNSIAWFPWLTFPTIRWFAFASFCLYDGLLFNKKNGTVNGTRTNRLVLSYGLDFFRPFRWLYNGIVLDASTCLRLKRGIHITRMVSLANSSSNIVVILWQLLVPLWAALLEQPKIGKHVMSSLLECLVTIDGLDFP